MLILIPFIKNQKEVILEAMKNEVYLALRRNHFRGSKLMLILIPFMKN